MHCKIIYQNYFSLVSVCLCLILFPTSQCHGVHTILDAFHIHILSLPEEGQKATTFTAEREGRELEAGKRRLQCTHPSAHSPLSHQTCALQNTNSKIELRISRWQSQSIKPQAFLGDIYEAACRLNQISLYNKIMTNINYARYCSKHFTGINSLNLRKIYEVCAIVYPHFTDEITYLRTLRNKGYTENSNPESLAPRGLCWTTERVNN